MLRPWFLQSKPKIILPDRTPDDSEFSRGLLPDNLVADIPWATDLDLSIPRHLRTAQTIIRLSKVTGQRFWLYRTSFVDLPTEEAAWAAFDHFPTAAEAQLAVGGGKFNIFAKTRPHALIFTFTLGGPKREPKNRTERRTQMAEAEIGDIKAEVLRDALRWLRDQPPDLQEQVYFAAVCKELDVPVPEVLSFEEQIVNEALRDPQFREEEGKRIMASRRVEAARAAESQNLDELLAYVKKVKRIAELMGYDRNAKPNAGAGLDEFMKTLLADGGLTDILKAFKNVRHPRNPAEARQASPGGEPPHAEEPPKVENTPHDSQVAEHLPPDTPPQSPAPPKPRVREKPGGSIGPRPFDLGVPADSLGLLGLRGDTSFVDRSLV